MLKTRVFIKQQTSRSNGEKTICFFSHSEKNGIQVLFPAKGLTYSEWDYFRNGRSLSELHNYHQRNYRVRKTIEHILLVLDHNEREYAAAIGLTPKVIRRRRKEALDYDLCF